MKQWLILLAFIGFISMNASAQNERKITLACNSSQTLYDIDLGTTCVEGNADERKEIIQGQIKTIINFNNAFAAAKISSLYICDNSNCPNPVTMDCNKSAQVLRVKAVQRKISDNKYEVKFFGVVKVSCSVCDTAAGGGGICGDDTFFMPQDILLECGTSQLVTIGPASLFFNGTAAQATNFANNAAQSLKAYYQIFGHELPINPKCYDIICEPNEICIATKSLGSVTSNPPVQVDDNPPCYRLDFYLNINVECSTCQEEKKDKEPQELKPEGTIIDQIYPNPVYDFVMIDLKKEQRAPMIEARAQNDSQQLKLYIVDQNGIQRYSSSFSAQEESIAISVNNLSNGIHFILIESDGSIVERRKIVVQKE